jgi:hypothetical protein
VPEAEVRVGYDEELAARVRDAVNDAALRRGLSLREKKMFGGLAFMVRDKMAVGVTNMDLMVRVGAAGYDDALARQHTREMDFTGKPMRGYVFVDPDGTTDPADVAFWVDQAVTNVETLG